MTSRTQIFFAALLAGAAATLAVAQTPDAVHPARPTGVEPSPYVAEPVASTSRKEGPNADVAAAIAEALNADAQLKGSKLTVVAEDDGVLLTGVVPKLAHLGRATQLAAQAAPEARVGSVISTEEVFIDAPQPAVAQVSVVEERV